MIATSLIISPIGRSKLIAAKPIPMKAITPLGSLPKAPAWTKKAAKAIPRPRPSNASLNGSALTPKRVRQNPKPGLALMKSCAMRRRMKLSLTRKFVFPWVNASVILWWKPIMSPKALAISCLSKTCHSSSRAGGLSALSDQTGRVRPRCLK